MKTVFIAAQAFTPRGTLHDPFVAVEDGHIVSIGSRRDQDIPPGKVVDFGEGILAPAFFDVHVHGGMGRDVMEATPEALRTVGRFLATHGVAAYLATTVTAPVDATLESLNGLARLIDKPGDDCARPLGIHLEGPFLSHEKRGVHPPKHLLPPSVAMFDRFWQASEGQIKLMTLAPELPGAEELIAHSTGLGVRVSLGHSNATASAARTGIAAGAVSATHTFNAMRHFDQREPGILGVVLDERGLFAEIISDGHHVDPVAVRLFWKAKGTERAILITDGISAAGMPDGTYKLGNLDVEVKDGKCLYEGAIAGSTLTMDRAVSNFREFTGARLDEVVGLAGLNPARMLGLEDRIGSLAAGRSADFVVLDANGTSLRTILRGNRIDI